MARKNRKKARDGRLAVQPTQFDESVVLKKVTLLKDGDKANEVQHMAGRKSYVERAIDQGLYDLIKANIRKFRTENINTSFADLYKYIQPLFPTVFDDENMDAGNFKKKINNDEGWRQAYFCNQTDLYDLANERMYEVLSNRELDPKVAISAYDKVMKYSNTVTEKDKLELETLRMKNKLIEAQIDKLKSNQIEDPYINSFLQNLSQIGDD